jgi:hypothetical protein
MNNIFSVDDLKQMYAYRMGVDVSRVVCTPRYVRFDLSDGYGEKSVVNSSSPFELFFVTWFDEGTFLSPMEVDGDAYASQLLFKDINDICAFCAFQWDSDDNITFTRPDNMGFFCSSFFYSNLGVVRLYGYRLSVV